MNTCTFYLQCGLSGEWLGLQITQRWHLYGLSPLWILLCTVRCPACANCFPQTEHSNGFSPEWIRLCSANSPFRRKHFPHSLHLYLLLWIFICCVKYFLFGKHFWHSVHEYTLSSARLLLPSLKRHWFAHCSSHTVQTGDRPIGFLFFRGLLISISDRTVLQLSPTHYTSFVTNVRIFLGELHTTPFKLDLLFSQSVSQQFL